MFSQKKGEGYIEHWIMLGVKTSSPWLENLPVKPLSNSNTLQDCRVMQQKIWLHTWIWSPTWTHEHLKNDKKRDGELNQNPN